MRLVAMCQREGSLPAEILIKGATVDVSEATTVAQTLNTDILWGVFDGSRYVCLRRYRTNIVSQAPTSRDGLIKAAIKDAVMSSCLRHSRIVPFEGVHQIGKELDRSYLAQAPYDTITEYLSKQPNADRKILLQDVAEALAYLHDNNIAHGGVNDRAVVVRADVGRAYLSDFSLAYFIGSEFVPTSYHRSRSSSLQDLSWQAPENLEELLRDECMAPSKASDIYAFGCLAFKVFVGNDPFEEFMGLTQPMAIAKIVNTVCFDDKRPAKPDIGRAVDSGLTEEIWKTMIEACWERDPHSRPDASELVRI